MRLPNHIRLTSYKRHRSSFVWNHNGRGYKLGSFCGESFSGTYTSALQYFSSSIYSIFFDQWPTCASVQARRMATETASRSKIVTSVLWGPKYLRRCLIGLISFWHPLPYRVQPFFFTTSRSDLLFQSPMRFAHGRATGSIPLMMKAHEYSV